MLDGVIILMGMAVLLVSVYSLLDNYWVFKNAADSSLLVYKPALQADNEEKTWVTLPEQAAWLFLNESYIDFPVMQGEDNFVYLDKDPYGDYRMSGSIFLDYRNDRDFEDDYSMIYGHHMDHYAMFGSLDLFTDMTYFQFHKEGWIATKKETYNFELFAVSWGDANDQTLFNPRNRTIDQILTYIDDHAIINTGYQPGNRIVALSTCAGETYTSRLILFGMLKHQ